MKTYILDFEEVLKNFEPYHQSLKAIQKDKQEFSDLVNSIKKEMEGIVNSSKSLILDDVTNQKNQNRFFQLLLYPVLFFQHQKTLSRQLS